MSKVKTRLNLVNESAEERLLRHVRRCGSREELEGLEQALRERDDVSHAVWRAIWERKHVEGIK